MANQSTLEHGFTTRLTASWSEYQAEFRGVVNYYRRATNLGALNHLRWVMEMSLAKTLAVKLKISVPQVFKRYKTRIPTDNGPRKVLMVKVDKPGKKPLVTYWGGVSLLLQIDGSHHRWLGEQGPRFALLLAVDDATGTVPDALFSQEEDTRGYFLLMEGLIRRCGIPLAVYSDRHAVFKHTGEVGQKPAGPTQFARAMEELGIRQIFARSPQAKGRVERTAGTFQDRLVTELRLAGVTTIDEANEVLHRFLPRFNEKFGVPAEHSSVAYRPMESSVALDQILCFKHRRKVARDNTVKYNWRTLQLLLGKERPSYAGAQLEVHEGLDGLLLVQYRGRTIPTQEAPPRPGVLRASNGPLRYDRSGSGNLNRGISGIAA